MKIKRRLKPVSTVISILMVLMTLVACNGNSEPKQAVTTVTTETEGSTTEVKDKPNFPLDQQIELSAATLDFGRERNTRIDQEIEKRTNIKFKWQIIAGDYAEKVNTMLAAGDVPDIIALCQPELQKYQNQGIFIDFSKYLDQMPNFQKWNAKFSDMENYFKTSNGNLYAINVLSTEGTFGPGLLYRKDVFDKNGLQVPTTTDEMYNVLKKLKQLYPDSYPYYSDKWTLSSGVLEFYHTDFSIFFDQDTMQYRYGPEMSNFMDTLRFARRLYSEGLVNPDFAVVTDDQITSQFNAGKGFIRYAWMMAAAGDISAGQKIDPDFKLAAMLPPVTETGLQGRAVLCYPTNNWWCVTGNAKGKYVDTVVKYLDYQMSDEFINLINWGFEGETYTVKDGQKEFIIGQDAIKGMGLDGRSGVFAPTDPNVPRVTAQNKDIISIFNLYNSNAEKIGIAKPPVITTPDDFNTKKNQVMTKIDTAMTEAYFKFITGSITEENMKKTIDDIVSKGEYKEFVNRMNEEFEKIKGNYKLDYNIK